MNPCKGEPAEKYALAYVEGSLAQDQAEQFEEHFIACALCQKAVLHFQELADELYENPIDATTAKSAAPVNAFLWPNLLWGALAFASLLLIAVIALQHHWTNGSSTDQAKTPPLNSPAAAKSPADQSKDSSTQAATQTPAPSATKPQFNASQLADLSLPVFDLHNLREQNADTHYQAGVQSYNAGNCPAALDSLWQVPANAREHRAALFFTGTCQLHMGNLQAADQALQSVVNAGDSPQLERALYELAQAALAANNPSSAHHYLAKAIHLHGDLEAKAREQDRKIVDLLKIKN